MPNYSDRTKAEPRHRVIPRWLRVPRIRITPRRIAAVLLVLGLGVFLGRDLIWPPSDEEQVREVFEDLVDAWADGDFEDVWDLCSRGLTDEFVANTLDGWRSMDADDPDWGKIEEFYGIDRDEALEMDAEEVYVVLQEALIEGDPEGWRRAQAGFRGLRIEKISIKGDVASIDCSKVAGNWICLWFRKEDGDWRLGGASEMGPMKFRVREGKIKAFLPKSPVRPESGRLVVEVGTNGVDAESLAQLGAALDIVLKGRPSVAGVVLDAWEELPFEDVIAVYTELHLKPAVEVAFASAGGARPPRGLRINGVDVSQIAPGAELPDPEDFSVFSRVIGLSQK